MRTEIEHCTTSTEDRKATSVLYEALREAFEAGKEDNTDAIPDASNLWEDLCAILDIRV